MPPPPPEWNATRQWPAPSLAPGRITPPEARKRRRWLILGGVGVLVLALAAGLLTYVLWPQPPETPPQVVAASVSDLTQWQGATYQGVVVEPDGVATGMDLTVTSTGTLHGTLTRDFGAQAEIAVDSSGTLLRGNRQWWLWDEPGSADALANTWVADPPDEITGLLPTSMLTPTAMANRMAGVTTTGWTQTGTTTVAGQQALVLTDGTRQITVTAASPHHVLSIGMAVSTPTPSSTSPAPWSSSGPSVSPGPSASTGPSDGPSASTGPSDGPSASAGPSGSGMPGFAGTAVDFRRVGGGAAAPPPEPDQLSINVSEPTNAAVTNAQNVVRNIRQAKVKPKPLDKAITLPDSVSTAVQASFCDTPECPATVMVTNNGQNTVSGTLFVSVAGQQLADTPITVPPGTTEPYPVVAQNTAPQGGQITVQWIANLYDPTVMGDDPDLARQLSQRGINLNKNIASSQPNSAPILQTLLGLTPNVNASSSTADRDQVTTATRVVSNAVNKRSFAPLYELATSGNLVMTDPEKNMADLAVLSDKLDQPGNRRPLEEAAQLAQAGNKVVLDTGYTPPGSSTTYKADILVVQPSTPGVKPYAIQFKTVTGQTSALTSDFKDALRQLNGETGEFVPPGFDKVVQLSIESNSKTGMGKSPGPELRTALQQLDLARLCAAKNLPTVKVIVTNYPPGPTGSAIPARYEFTCDELQP